MNYRIANGSISYGAETILEEINFEIKEKEDKMQEWEDWKNVARSVIIRESMYKKLEEMRERYGISISKLMNIAIRNGLNKYDKNK